MLPSSENISRHGIRSKDERHLYFRMTWAVQDKSFISLALLWLQELKRPAWISAEKRHTVH
jgi:hypothetical protein